MLRVLNRSCTIDRQTVGAEMSWIDSRLANKDVNCYPRWWIVAHSCLLFTRCRKKKNSVSCLVAHFTMHSHLFSQRLHVSGRYLLQSRKSALGLSLLPGRIQKSLLEVYFCDEENDSSKERITVSLPTSQLGCPSHAEYKSSNEKGAKHNPSLKNKERKGGVS